jgi:homoserine O-acetyltransferase
VYEKTMKLTGKKQMKRKTSDSLNRFIDIFEPRTSLSLDCGAELPDVRIAYETYGKLNADATNAVLICHALTGSAHVAGNGDFPAEFLEKVPLLRSIHSKMPGWWNALIGPGKLFDTNEYFIISSNILGSCYGSSGPDSTNPLTGKKYGLDFPQVTVRDMVKAQYTLIRYLGVEQLALITGGSLGGMQVLEWAVMYPHAQRSIVPIATAARHSDWCIGLNHLAREAILNDPAWQKGIYTQQPAAGLSLARKVGMISYRADISVNARFGYERIDPEGNIFNNNNIFQVENYLNYQGKKLVERFDANCFLCLSRAMDLQDISRDRGRLSEVLASIRAKTVCVGVNTDILYPAHEQRLIAAEIPGAIYREIKSVHGHDAFLIEFDQITEIIRPLLREVVT